MEKLALHKIEVLHLSSPEQNTKQRSNSKDAYGTGKRKLNPCIHKMSMSLHFQNWFLPP